MNPVRCSHCGRAGLPPVPGEHGGRGELALPVAHVREQTLKSGWRTYEPCFAGVSRELLAVCVEPGILAPRIAFVKDETWNDETLWDL